MGKRVIMTRHGESAYNVAGLTNGDHSVPVALSPRGVEQARGLAAQLAGVEIGACVHTRFRRTSQTARLALADTAPRPTFVCEPLLDDIGCGSLEGRPVREEFAWRGTRRRDHGPPGGESITEAARRIALGLRSIACRTEPVVAVVTHELIVRYALNAASGSADIAAPRRRIPNATPFEIGGDVLLRAADRIETLASGPWGLAIPGLQANGG